MQQVPIQPVPSQRVSTILGGQNVQVQIYQKSTGMFVDIACNGVIISTCVIARDAVVLNPCTYNPFVGNLFLIDTQGSSDPDYTGLGSRFQLLYMTEDEIVQLQQ